MKFMLKSRLVKNKQIPLRSGECFNQISTQHHKSLVKIVTIADLFKPIDKILYINLEKRQDRRAQMEAQFRRLGIPEEKIVRIDAVEHQFGALGATRSHIKSLEWAKEHQLKNVLILEDDFDFIPQHLGVNLHYLSQIKEPWDVIMFSANPRILEPHDQFMLRVRCALTASGYLIHHGYFDTLITNYRQSSELLERSRIGQHHALDVWFQPLQRRDRWFLFKNRLGYQRPSYSDIEGRHVNYGC